MKRLLGSGKVLAAGSLFVLAVGMLVFTIPHNHIPTLLERATRVASISDWNLTQANYWWLSSHEVLFLRGSEKQGWTFFRRDLRTEKEETLNDLTSLVRRAYASATSLSLSPDRRTLLLYFLDPSVRGVTLDGRSRFIDSYQTRNHQLFGIEFYMGGSSDWVEAVLPTPVGNGPLSALILHDASRPGAPKTITFNPPLEIKQRAALTSQNHFIIVRVIPFSTPTTALSITDVDLSATAPTPRTHSLQLPSPIMSAFSFQCAPGGDRLAWQSSVEQVASGSAIWRWFLRFNTRSPARPRHELWVSGMHGEGMHAIVTMPNSTSTLAPSWQLKLQWLPDGKTLSFIHDGSLWTVPAD
jgi:hypothetical protein